MYQDLFDPITGKPNQINDKGMEENPFKVPVGESQGLAPYPYEIVTPLPVDKSRQGAVIEIIHLRKGAGQLLNRIVIPSVAPLNPKSKIYYQLGGFFVIVHDDLGVIAKIIVSSLHPAYTFKIVGVRTEGAGVPVNRTIR